MPELDLADDDRNIAIPSSDPQNILDFSTVVDGRPVTAQVEQKALVSGVDQTEILRKLGIPVADPLDALAALPRSEWRHLKEAGLAKVEDVGTGQATKEQLRAQWT